MHAIFFALVGKNNILSVLYSTRKPIKAIKNTRSDTLLTISKFNRRQILQKNIYL